MLCFLSICLYVCVSLRIDGWMDGWTAQKDFVPSLDCLWGSDITFHGMFSFYLSICVSGWMDGSMDRSINGTKDFCASSSLLMGFWYYFSWLNPRV